MVRMTEHTDTEATMAIDTTGCNYCGEDFEPGDVIRGHHRGGFLHEACIQEHWSYLTPAKRAAAAKFYADETTVYQPCEACGATDCDGTCPEGYEDGDLGHVEDTDTESIDISICVDCAVWHANGDISGIDDEVREAEVRAAAGIGTGTVVVGDGEAYFSWSRCDACRTTLGGDRIDSYLLVPVNAEGDQVEDEDEDPAYVDDEGDFGDEQVAEWLERPVFVWFTDGEPYTGSLATYAKHVEEGSYAGIDVTGLQVVRGPGRLEDVEVTRTRYEADDYLTVTLEAEGQTATYRIDLRA